MNKNNLTINYWILLGSFVIIFIGAFVTVIFFIKTSALVNLNLAKAKEAKRPANLELTIINDKNCADCFNLGPVLESIKKENVNITAEKTLDLADDEAKALIAKFNIVKAPTFIVKGEIDKNQTLKNYFSKAGAINDGVFVFKQTGGPYVLTATGETKGLVKLTLLTDITCTECYDVTQHETILKQFGIGVPGKIVDTKSADGKMLVNKYGIKTVPTFVLSGDIKEYPSLKAVWSEVGKIAYDGAFIFTKGVPLMGVYKDLSTNKIIQPAAK